MSLDTELQYTVSYNLSEMKRSLPNLSNLSKHSKNTGYTQQISFIETLARAIVIENIRRHGTPNEWIDSGEDCFDILDYHSHPDTWKRDGMSEDECHVFKVDTEFKTYKFAFVKGTICAYIFRQVLIPWGNIMLYLHRPFCHITLSDANQLAIVSLLSMEMRRCTNITLSKGDLMDDQTFTVYESESGDLTRIDQIDLSDDNSQCDISVDATKCRNVNTIASDIWNTVEKLEKDEREIHSFDNLISKLTTCPQAANILISLL